MPYSYASSTTGQGPRLAQISEAEIKERIRRLVLPGFRTLEEVAGIHPVYGACKIDFLCYPNPEVIANGWPTHWFGIETKGADVLDQHLRIATLLVRQARIYRESVYTIDGNETRPHFVLFSPPIESYLDVSDRSEDFRDGFAYALDKVAGFDRVGALGWAGDYWTVRFHHQGDLTFHSRDGRWRNIAQISRKNGASR